MEKPILYCCIHKRLIQKVDGDNIMSKQEFKKLLGQIYGIPQSLKVIVLKEMVNLNMVEDLGTGRSNNIRILPLQFDPEENLSIIYAKVSLF